MNNYVVDTNVLIVANGRNTNTTLQCRLNCIDKLTLILSNDRILIDNLGLIFAEYKNYMCFSGQPGVGDQFFKWLHENQAVTDRCLKINITPLNGNNDFEEFPNSEDLNEFDRNDRKFVAVAIASQKSPPILNAVDSDWWDFQNALEAESIVIEFLCERPPF